MKYALDDYLVPDRIEEQSENEKGGFAPVSSPKFREGDLGSQVHGMLEGTLQEDENLRYDQRWEDA